MPNNRTTTIEAGKNYVAHKNYNRTADVLKVGNGLVVFREYDNSSENKPALRMLSETQFRRRFNTKDDIESLTGTKTGKAVILRTLPEAEMAWT